jgi:hypothetical protein
LVLLIYRYAYQSYIQNAFYMSKQYKDSVLTGVGYFGDQDGHFQDVFKKMPQILAVENVRKRWELISNSKWIDLTGPINVPFFDSENFLLNNINVDLELIRSSPEFLLYDETDGVKYKIEIRNPVLTVRRYKPSAPIVASITRGLEKSKAKFSYRNVDMKAINFAKDLTRINIPNITTGQIPSRIIFAFVESQGYNGSYKKNPFFFQNFGIKNVRLFVNSEQYPSVQMEYDFTNNLVGQGYDFFVEQLGLHPGKTNGITKFDYTNGYSIWVYDLTSDLSASQEHFSMIQTGNLFAEINFNTAPKVEITCIIYSEYEKLIEVDEYRNIRTDDQLF